MSALLYSEHKVAIYHPFRQQDYNTQVKQVCVLKRNKYSLSKPKDTVIEAGLHERLTMPTARQYKSIASIQALSVYST